VLDGAQAGEGVGALGGWLHSQLRGFCYHRQFAWYIDIVYTLLSFSTRVSVIAFDWDEANIAHLKRHRVSAAEFEEVIKNDPLDLDHDSVSGEDRYRSLGETNRGRVLIVVWTFRRSRIRAITAYRARRSYVRLYRGE